MGREGRQRPIEDQKRSVKAAGGHTLPDGKIAVMDYYVEGGQGPRPKS